MKNQRPYRKFKFVPKKIDELDEKDHSFRRIFSEYECLTDELWSLQNTEDASVTDDFLEAVLLQKDFLEETIERIIRIDNFH